jgi:hypothetical protein
MLGKVGLAENVVSVQLLVCIVLCLFGVCAGYVFGGICGVWKFRDWLEKYLSLGCVAVRG